MEAKMILQHEQQIIKLQTQSFKSPLSKKGVFKGAVTSIKTNHA
jgi:hypothetical protein